MTTLPQTSGIYQIRNTKNNRIYLGSTVNFNRRWIEHKKKLVANKHCNSKLQRAWNKYGKDLFVFEILLVCDKAELLIYEQQYIDKLQVYKEGYNCAPKAGNTLGLKKKPLTEEQRQRASVARLGKIKPLSEEGKQAVIAANKSRIWTDEAKERVRQSKLGKTISEETKLKMSETHKKIPGKPHTEEVKERLSAIAKTQNRTISPELQAKMREARNKKYPPCNKN